MDKILVTGSAGLIGSSVAQKLKNNGYEVIDCDIRFVNNSLSFFSEDIKPLLNECTGIIHLAAIARVIHGEQYPELCGQVNVSGTKKFLKFYESLPHKPWLIYGSSREVYGNQDHLPVVESANFDPVNIYAKGKVKIENKIKALGNQGFDTAILRFSNVYGGLLDHNDRVIPAFCINALKNSLIRIDGKECVFDFTYIDDVVEGILLTVKKMRDGKKIEQPIHFTGCRGCSLEELVKIIFKMTGSKSSIDYRPPRNFDVSRFYGDFSNAQKLLGWKPKHSLEEGIEKFVLNIQKASSNCPYNVKMEIYENIESYSWLPALL